MTKNMPNPQVSYAVVKANFNPVAAMENYINDIQDELRKMGYTNFERKHSPHLEAPIESELSLSEANAERTPTWWITNRDQTSGFTLGTTNLSFHATNYESFSKLVSEWLAGLHSVHEVVSLDHISRLGFRNFDVVMPEEDETACKHMFTSSNQTDSGLQQQYALKKFVFKTDCGSPNQNGCLTYKVHLTDSPIDFPIDFFTKGSALEEKLTQDKESVAYVMDTEHFIAGQYSLDFTQIHEALSCLFAKAESALGAVVVREFGETENWMQGSMLRTTLFGHLGADLIHARSLPDVRTVPEHIENIRGTLNPKMADLAAIFDVSRQAIYKWISRDTTPEDETIHRVLQLSRISDQFREANVSRAETLLKMKTFDGHSLMDLIQSGENTDEHINALINEARAMESSYINSRLADSKAIPTDDWLSSISIPGSFEKD